MGKTTIQIIDRKFRIVIPKDIRALENIDVGDFIELDIKKIEKSSKKNIGEKEEK